MKRCGLNYQMIKRYYNISVMNENIYKELNVSKYIKTWNISNYNFIIYGLMHGQICGNISSGEDCRNLIQNIKMDYILLELCKERLNKICNDILVHSKEGNYIIKDKHVNDNNIHDSMYNKTKNLYHNQIKNQKLYHNDYNKFSYLPRIHNGFLKNEFIPIIEECLKNNLNIFSCDRNIHIVKNRLDAKLLYDTKSYRNFFTYCTESIALRHYSYNDFIKLYKNYYIPTQNKDQTTNTQNDLNLNLNQNLNNLIKFIKNKNIHPNKTYNHNNQTCTYLDNLNKLNILPLLNERLKHISKPTYDVLVEEKYKYMVHNIWCFLLNNEKNIFQNNEHNKNILIVCSSNIIEQVYNELQEVYLILFNKYKNNMSLNQVHNNTNIENLHNNQKIKHIQPIVYQNIYSSYNDYIKPHWPLILLKYYILPYLILYFLLNTLYNLIAWIYKSNMQNTQFPSPKIIKLTI
ncbi:hypothetical protein PFTANZ_04161 [Plasmodium falciparum Tanzania (2000708)]|uniref:Uncharacterized protein n=2 Tax=Plasmodium falciparum TaxID=5833 RepID=A0A024W3K3_PLAFA|nr:hypothetical protein PFFCH_02818 [Plasmodium falciparum FCH/4]ETW35115.1 hypothetical protein PFTANZ_04161 [Plasmodium falciparum Tanzania (2000708)]